MNLSAIVADMQRCDQTRGQSVYQHGQSVQIYLFHLLESLRNGESPEGWRLPDWVFQYRERLLENLLSREVLANYTLYHDCGKPYCRVVDADGRQHFTDHAEVSFKTWMDNGGDEQTGRLIRSDMDIHTMKAEHVEEFCRKTSPQEAATLLLTGLAELHSNASMFGGIESTSFKIKFKQIDKRGKAICQVLFGPVTINKE